MVATRSRLTSSEQLTDWQDPVDFGLVPSRYTLSNLSPKLPVDGADLRDVMPPDHLQGRRESWEEAAQRLDSYARSEFGYGSPEPYRAITLETRLLVGTLALPTRLVRGTYKRLFGEISETPSTYALLAVAHALFNPPMEFWGGESWIDACRRAELAALRRARITAQVKELLALGE